MAIDKKTFALIMSKQKKMYESLKKEIGAIYPLLLDGSKQSYDNLMKAFFDANNANSLTPAGLTDLVDRWYSTTRAGWDGGIKFYQPDVSSVSTGTKVGDNAGLECIPSTNEAANKDDYAGLPLFACVDCNFIVDAETLEPQITAIDGITDNFTRTDPDVFVGVLQMAGYTYFDEDAETYTFGYSDYKNRADARPLPEAVRVDKTVRDWVVHAKYMSKTIGGKLTSYAGVIPTAYSVSHNTIHTLARAIGSQYSGGCLCDLNFIRLMAFLKYGSMSLDGVLQGCVNYNYQYDVKVGEENTNRLILSAANGANLFVGSGVLIGNFGGNKDRGQAAMYSISTNAGRIITAIEDVEIEGTAYKAVTVDGDPFTTVANGADTNGTTYLSTFHWPNGSCDNVLGNDGSPAAPGTGTHPAKIQGIEYSVGGYEVLSDIIMNKYQDEDEKYYYRACIVDLASKQATSVTANYRKPSTLKAVNESSGWKYIRKIGYEDGDMFPIDVTGGSSSTFTKDGFYQDGPGTGTREYLAFGSLSSGVAFGGLSYVYGGYGLPSAYWNILGRLSPNGNRGEFAA